MHSGCCVFKRYGVCQLIVICGPDVVVMSGFKQAVLVSQTYPRQRSDTTMTCPTLGSG
jgi:hypothetical protein